MLAAPPLRLRTYLLPAPHLTSHAHSCAHTPHTPTLPPSPDYGTKIYTKTATQTKNTLWGCHARVDLIPAPTTEKSPGGQASPYSQRQVPTYKA